MAQTSLTVKLLALTPNALKLVYAACRQCYSSQSAGELFEKDVPQEKMTAFIKRIIASGHESPLEHVSMSFAVAGVSRALTHQLVRHRLASYSQQSQRYVKEADFDFITPPSIKADPACEQEFLTLMQTIQDGYNSLLEKFKTRGVSGEKANQDIRFVLPQAAETKIVVTMNVRELLHFFKQRCCTRAQWEIRAMANQMLDLCKQELPLLFTDAGAKCEQLKFCPEGEGFCCGRYPVKPSL